MSSKTTSLEFFTNLKFAFAPEIFSPSSKIFFSPMTNMFASSTIFSQSSLDTISGPIPDGSPNNIAILFYLTLLSNINLSLNLINYFFSKTKKTVSV